MKLNHADVVLSFEGEPLQEPAADGPRDVTFRSLAITALNGLGDQEHMGAEDKARCYELSTKFFKGKFVSLTVDEAAFVKQRGGIVLTALAYGRLAEWLEGLPQTIASDVEDDAAVPDGT